MVNEMKDLMIDLETLGTTPSSPIIAIGAVFFNPTTGDIGDAHNQFEVIVDFKSAMECRTPDGPTVKWWMEQSEAARMKVTSGVYSMAQALVDLSAFIGEAHDDDFTVWGNGATFDISMLEDAYRQYGLDIPWPRWGINDCRTIERFSSVKRSSIKRKGVHHSALDDAIYQAEYISAMVQQLIAS